MQGAEAVSVLAVISSINTTIDGTKQAYDFATDQSLNPHKAFRDVAAQLSVVRNTLNAVEQDIKEERDSDEVLYKGMKPIVHACEKKATRLNDLFQNAFARTGTERFFSSARANRSWTRREAIEAKILIKRNEAKILIKGMLEDVQLLASKHGMKTVTRTQVEQPAKAIAEAQRYTSAEDSMNFGNSQFHESDMPLPEPLGWPRSGMDEIHALYDFNYPRRRSHPYHTSLDTRNQNYAPYQSSYPTLGAIRSNHEDFSVPTLDLNEDIISNTSTMEKHLSVGEKLVQAIKLNKLEEIKKLIEEGCDVNEFVPNKVDGELLRFHSEIQMPLHEAVDSSLDATRLILDAGAAVDRTTSLYGTALQRAIRSRRVNDRYEIVQLLLDCGANVNAAAGCFGTALGSAAAQNDEAMVLLLLNNGANVNQHDGVNHGTALMRAAEYADCPVVKLLLDHGADSNIEDVRGRGNALLFAINRSNEELVRLLLKHGADSNVQIPRVQYRERSVSFSGPPLLAAAANGSLAVIRALLEYGAKIDEGNEIFGPPVIAAAFSGHTEATLLLREHGSDPSNFTWWWQQQNTKHKEEANQIPMPEYLTLWEAASLGRDFQSISALVTDISKPELGMTFTSLTWNWELPAVMGFTGLDGGYRR